MSSISAPQYLQDLTHMSSFADLDTSVVVDGNGFGISQDLESLIGRFLDVFADIEIAMDGRPRRQPFPWREQPVGNLCWYASGSLAATILYEEQTLRGFAKSLGVKGLFLGEKISKTVTAKNIATRIIFNFRTALWLRNFVWSTQSMP